MLQHHLDVGAAAPSLAAAAIGQKGEGPASTTRQTPQFTNQTQHPNDTEIGAVCLDAAGKLKATAAAELALRGFSLQELADGSFAITRWNLCRPCAGLADVRQFIRQIGGAA